MSTSYWSDVEAHYAISCSHPSEVSADLSFGGGHKRVLFVFVGGAKTLIGFLSAHAVLWHALPLKIMVRTSLW